MAITLVVAAPADAGVLETDSAAIVGWHGKKDFQNNIFPSPTYDFFAKVDYAVYAPGQMANSDHFDASDDPSGGTEYVYAYQIFNTGQDTLPITELSVGLNNDEVVANQQSLPDPLGPPSHVPDDMSFQGAGPTYDSAWWFFDKDKGNDIPVGDPDPKSEILIFTSPSGPEWGSA